MFAMILSNEMTDTNKKQMFILRTFIPLAQMQQFCMFPKEY